MNLPQPLSYSQWLTRLEEWASTEQLESCASTLKRFYATGYEPREAVTWLELRESTLREVYSREDWYGKTGDGYESGEERA